MIILTHYDECRDTVQLIHVADVYARETRAQYRARMLPIAQAHAAAVVDYPEFINWDTWLATGCATDGANDEFYVCTFIEPYRRRAGSPKDWLDFDSKYKTRVVSSEEVIADKQRRITRRARQLTTGRRVE